MYVGIGSPRDELAGLTEADPGQRGQVVASRQDAHVTELVEAEVLRSHPHREVESLAFHHHSVTHQIHLEQDLRNKK